MKRIENPVRLVRVQYTGASMYKIEIEYEDVDGVFQAVDASVLIGGLAVEIARLQLGDDPQGNYIARAAITDGRLLLDEREI